MNGARKPRKPRWLPTADTMILAKHQAAKPAVADRNEVLSILRAAHKALSEGVATELQWSVLAGGLDTAKAIERQGIVRGLSEHLNTADRALQAIYDRAMHSTGRWFPTALYFHELEAVSAFVDVHAFQVNQLGRAEMIAALDAAATKIRAGGDKALVVREVERMAA